MARLAAAPVASLVFIATASAPAAAAGRFDVQVHVAQKDGTPVATDAWLKAQWGSVRTLLGPAGIDFAPHVVATESKPLPRILETRADRDGLKHFLVAKTLNVFVVESLKDVDEENRQRMGVHWRAGGSHFVIVATYAVPGGAPCPPQYRCSETSALLAHELGHFFGLGHDDRADNVMSYTRAGGPLWLDEPQKARMARNRNAEIAKGLTILPASP